MFLVLVLIICRNSSFTPGSGDGGHLRILGQRGGVYVSQWKDLMKCADGMV